MGRVYCSSGEPSSPATFWQWQLEQNQLVGVPVEIAVVEEVPGVTVTRAAADKVLRAMMDDGRGLACVSCVSCDA